MPLTPGTRLGPYEILSPLGAGGMGEVYRATDTTLGRQVAIKILPEAFASDPERLARFEREAKTLASLNHPHIAAIYAVEKSAGLHALVMELVEGVDLSQRIARGAIPLDEALPIAKQIAEALEAAHEQGIIHRDLKPANIKIRPDGTAKVLDFGLAKAMDPVGSAPNVSQSPTITTPAMTQAGMILGTAAYMSPEQAKGRAADKRSDVWAFGCVLYEMLTGARAFEGDDVSDTIAAVLRGEPDWTALPPEAPASVRDLIRHCLEKDRRQRVADISVVSYVLNHPRRFGPRDGVASGSSPHSRWVGRGLGGIATVATLSALALGFVHLRETRTVPRAVRFQVPLPEKTGTHVFAVSPDGRHLAIDGVPGRRRLGVRRLDSLELVPFPGTDGASYPFWSPDSTFIGFFADEKLKKVAVAGGPPQTICDAPGGRRATWNAEGTIVFASLGRGLARVAAAGGAPALVTTPARANELHRFPAFLPDGQRFLFLVTGGTPDTNGIYVGSLDGTAPVRLLRDESNAIYAPGDRSAADGHLLFVRDNTLMAQPFNANRAAFTGETFPVAEQVGAAGNLGNWAFSISSNGVLAFETGIANVSRELVWIDRSGKRVGVVGEPGLISTAGLSPDDRKIAFVLSRGGGEADIWVHDSARGGLSRLTSRPGFSVSPVWSPDGSSIVFSATNSRALYRKPVDGGGQEELLLQGGINLRPLDWSRDGKFLVYEVIAEGRGDTDLWLLPLDGSRTPVPYLQTPAREFDGQLSPDGRWMAYSSTESGPPQTYVQPIPTNGSKWQISSAGGVQPRWRRDGRELFYLSTDDQQVMAVAVRPSSTFEHESPRPVFKVARVNDPNAGFVYQPASDGQRFLVTAPVEGAPPLSITVVLNWQSALTARESL